jgi:uncharacterized protein (DUF2236 family)
MIMLAISLRRIADKRERLDECIATPTDVTDLLPRISWSATMRSSSWREKLPRLRSGRR